MTKKAIAIETPPLAWLLEQFVENAQLANDVSRGAARAKLLELAQGERDAAATDDENPRPNGNDDNALLFQTAADFLAPERWTPNR